MLTSAASLTRMPTVAFAAGLSLLACAESDDDADGDTQETLDFSGADYGGPPPCDELANAIPIAVGSNPIDTSMSGDDFSTSCGDQVGTGPDLLLEFAAPASGHFTFALNTSFDAWLLYSDDYCYTNGEAECMPNQGFEIDLVEGATLYLIVDGSTDGGGTGTVDVTQD
jgi:hypothetical protein